MARVLAANDVVDVIGASLELTPSGSGRFKALCPFHTEKTPSFIVSRDRQSFYCFGCEKGGDAITFLRDHEGMNFREALEHLASRAGIRLPEFTGRSKTEDSVREGILALAKDAQRFFAGVLKDPKRGQAGHEHLEKRGLSDETVKLFGLGCAMDTWTGLLDDLDTKRHSNQVLDASGLFKTSDKGRRYDFFRNRLMFPIRDTSGNIMAFGGRDLGEGPAKYVNSPENAVYKKGRVLYALFEAREAIRKSHRAILVEGYFDVLRCFDGGVKNAVATCGTALTPDQAKLIHRYATEVVVVYDGDAAGVRAALRSIGILTAAGLSVRALLLPGGQDPDDFIAASGAEAFQGLIEQSLDFVSFYTEVNADRTESIEGRMEVARDLFAILHDIHDEMRRDEYLKLIAQKLGSNLWNVRREFARYDNERARTHALRQEPQASGPKANLDEQCFVASLMADSTLLAKARKALTALSLAPGPLPEVLKVLFESPETGGYQSLDSEEGRVLYAAAAAHEADEDSAWGVEGQQTRDGGSEMVDKFLLRLRKESLSKQADELKEQLSLAVRMNDETVVRELMSKKVGIDREIDRVGAV